jgi:hypothetical protein
LALTFPPDGIPGGKGGKEGIIVGLPYHT